MQSYTTLSLLATALTVAAQQAQPTLQLPFVGDLFDGSISGRIVGVTAGSTTVDISCAHETTPTPVADPDSPTDGLSFPEGCLYSTVHVTTMPSANAFEIEGIDALSRTISVACTSESQGALNATCTGIYPNEGQGEGESQTVQQTGALFTTTMMLPFPEESYAAVTITEGAEALTAPGATAVGSGSPTGTGAPASQSSTGAASRLGVGMVGVAGLLAAVVAL